MGHKTEESVIDHKGLGDEEVLKIPVVFMDQRDLGANYQRLLENYSNVEMHINYTLTARIEVQSYLSTASNLISQLQSGHSSTSKLLFQQLQDCLRVAAKGQDENGTKLLEERISANFMRGDIFSSLSPSKAAGYYLTAITDSRDSHIPSLTNIADMLYKHDIDGVVSRAERVEISPLKRNISIASFA